MKPITKSEIKAIKGGDNNAAMWACINACPWYDTFCAAGCVAYFGGKSVVRKITS